jgi:DNA polymerase-3 subunit epsilon
MFRELLDKFSRGRAVRAAGHPVMQDFLRVLPPPGRTRCNELEIVALDFETTGLDPQVDHILSIGLVEIRGMSIHLDTAWHQLVTTDRPLPEETVVIHQITDDQAAEGLKLDDVLPMLLERLKGKVLLAHHAKVEKGFLDAACRNLYGAPFMATIIDTEALARRTKDRRHLSYKPRDLRLYNLRDEYRLPKYRSHNALNDALATAELFLAMATDIASPASCRLSDLRAR